MPPRRPSIRFALLLAYLAARGFAQTEPEPDHRDAPLLLDSLTVEGDADNAPGYDPTGLGGAEAERHEPPFANDLLEDIGADEMPLGELDNELAALAAAGSDAAQVAAGGENLDLRGFPTPTRRNGFTQTGVPEILNSQGGENIAGSLVSVVGRAAPGGIRNAFTARPKGRSERSLDAGFGTDGSWRAGARIVGVITPKKAWHLESFSASGREGPQDYSSITNTAAGVAFAFKHSRATSTLWSLDVAESAGNPAPGLPDYRLTPGGKIQSPTARWPIFT
jgi:iron complex outermembrane receptor protein